ncbi:MAG: hypothetical protein JXR96_22635 [Deltaproteobacteria bacterium]|nr:hypothetical protein [Deltaproteobacteria bacterium]
MPARYPLCYPLLLCLGLFCLACQPGERKADARPTRPLADSRLLDFVPADTPYVFAAPQGFPAALVDRIWAGWPEHETEGGEQAELRLLQAVRKELGGRIETRALKRLGFTGELRLVFYGVGLLPVLRLELADPAAVLAFVQRVLDASGAQAQVMRAGQQSYFVFEEDAARVLLAVCGRDLVLSVCPQAELEQLAPHLLGLQRPAKSLAQAGRLAEIAKRYGFRGTQVGFVDLQALVEHAACRARDPISLAVCEALAEQEGGSPELARVSSEKGAGAGGDGSPGEEKRGAGAGGDGSPGEEKRGAGAGGDGSPGGEERGAGAGGDGSPGGEKRGAGAGGSPELARVSSEKGAGAGGDGSPGEENALARGRGSKRPELIDASCQAELSGLAARMPLLVLGYDRVEAQRVEARCVWEMEPALAAELAALRGPEAGLLAPGAHPLFGLWLSLDLDRAMTFLTDKLSRVERAPYACEMLQGINQLSRSWGSAQGAVPAAVRQVHEISVQVEHAALEGFKLSELRGRAALGLERPMDIWGLLAMVDPALAGAQLAPDGEPVRVSGVAGLPGDAHLVAVQGRHLAVSTGEPAGAFLEQLAGKRAGPAIFELRYDRTRIGSIWDSFTESVTTEIGKVAETEGQGKPPAPGAEKAAAPESVLQTYVLDFTPQGIECRMRTDYAAAASPSS